jgi:hypothetical protein
VIACIQDQEIRIYTLALSHESWRSDSKKIKPPWRHCCRRWQLTHLVAAYSVCLQLYLCACHLQCNSKKKSSNWSTGYRHTTVPDPIPQIISIVVQLFRFIICWHVHRIPQCVNNIFEGEGTENMQGWKENLLSNTHKKVLITNSHARMARTCLRLL